MIENLDKKPFSRREVLLALGGSAAVGAVGGVAGAVGEAKGRKENLSEVNKHMLTPVTIRELQTRGATAGEIALLEERLPSLVFAELNRIRNSIDK